MIQTQQQLWHQRELRANQWLTLLTHRATLLQNALTRLAELETTWSETRKAALAAKAPEPIIAQIDGVLEAVKAAEGPLTTQRTAVLDLQSLVAEQVARSENIQARFREAQQRAVGGILTRDAPPLWDATGWVGAREAFSDRLTETIGGWGADQELPPRSLAGVADTRRNLRGAAGGVLGGPPIGSPAGRRR